MSDTNARKAFYPESMVFSPLMKTRAVYAQREGVKCSAAKTAPLPRAPINQLERDELLHSKAQFNALFKELNEILEEGVERKERAYHE